MSTDGSTLGYPELLKLATSNGLLELAASVVQAPSEANHHHAIVLAGARTSRALYQALGEARRDALPEALRAHVVTVAERRAKIRALCEAVGMPQPLPAPDPASAAPGAATVAAAAVEARDAGADETRLHEQQTRLSGSALRPSRAASAPAVVPTADSPGSEGDAASGDEAAEATVPARVASRGARPAGRAPAALAEGIGPDILARLLQMARKKAELEGGESSEEEAMRKLDSFFQRAFGHSLAEGSRMEGQRVVQRLAADLARLSGGEPMQATG